MPETCRFLVALPSPLAPVLGMVAPEAQAEIEPAYARVLWAELDAMFDRVPVTCLAIQRDTPIELAILEGAKPSFLTGQAHVQAELVRCVTRFAPVSSSGVETKR